MFKINNKDTRTMSRRYVVLVALLLTLSIFHFFSSVSIVNFEELIACWVELLFQTLS